MAEETLIAWTSHTFNGWLGCTKVSAGCANCYAETLATNRMGLNVWGPTATRKVTTTPGRTRGCGTVQLLERASAVACSAVR